MKPPPRPRTPQPGKRAPDNSSSGVASKREPAVSDRTHDVDAAISRSHENPRNAPGNSRKRAQKSLGKKVDEAKSQPSGSTEVVRRRVTSTATGVTAQSGKAPEGEPRTSKFDLTPKDTVLRDAATKSKGLSPKVPVLSTGVADRLAERQAIEVHDKRKKRIIWILILVFIGFVVWLFGFSKAFSLDLDQVKVAGTAEFVTDSEVIAAIASQEGVALTRINLGKINEDVASLKNVKSVTQTRRWPKGVSITIQERVPVAAVPAAKKTYILLDMEAVEVATVAKAPEGLPIIKIPMTGENERTLAATLEILDALDAALLAEIGSITAESQDNIVFALRDGVKVQWGNSSDTELKSEVLKRLRPIAKEEGKKAIDLSAPTFPIIRK